MTQGETIVLSDRTIDSIVHSTAQGVDFVVFVGPLSSFLQMIDTSVIERHSIHKSNEEEEEEEENNSALRLGKHICGSDTHERLADRKDQKEKSLETVKRLPSKEQITP